MKRLLYISSLLFFLILPLFAGQKIINVSGDNQFGIIGFPLADDFVVRIVSDKNVPAAGVPVSFVIISQPQQPQDLEKAAESTLSGPLAITDSNGYAKIRLNLGYPNQGEVLVSASSQETVGNPVVFNSVSHKRNWISILVFECIAGLGLFLFGMFYLNDALQKIVGQKLKEILITLTGSPLKGLFTGFSVTLFNQASSATTVLEVSLVNAGFMTFYQSMAVTMGAEIGSTMTAQLIAFKITSYAVLIIGTGFFVSFFTKNKKQKHFGDMVVGIGVIFLGMKIMSEIIMPVRSYGPFVDAMNNLQNPLYGIFVGFVFTSLVRSSGVTVGIIIALALAGAVSLVQSVPVILGAELGTCLTALIAAVGRGREGERVALWHVFHQFAGVLIVLPLFIFFTYNNEPLWIYFVKYVTSHVFSSNDLARQIAMSHTLTALLNATIFLPLLPLANKVFCRILPVKEEQKPFGPIYIDDGFLSTPSLAISQARKEIVREGEIVLDMMDEMLKVFQAQDLKLCETISFKEMHSDKLRNAIVPYLTKLGQGYLSEELSDQEIQLLFITDDFESIGDVIDKNILPMMRKKFDEGLWFSDEGWDDIVKFHEKVTFNMRRALESLKNNDLEIARMVVSGKPEIDSLHTELHKRHITRLHSSVQESLETSGMHLDLISQLRTINSHVTSVCRTLLGNL